MKHRGLLILAAALLLAFGRVPTASRGQFNVGHWTSAQGSVQVPASDVISLVGTVTETAFATAPLVTPANALVAGKSVRVRAWMEITSGSTSPVPTFRIRYGPTYPSAGVFFVSAAVNAQATNSTRSLFIEFTINGTAAAGSSAPIYGTGYLLGASAFYPNQQSAVLNSATNQDQFVYITVSSTSGVGSQIKLLTVSTEALD